MYNSAKNISVILVCVYICIFSTFGKQYRNKRAYLLGGSVIKNMPANAGDVDLIPGWGRSPGEGNGNTLKYSCLSNPMDRGIWWLYPWGHKESDMI